MKKVKERTKLIVELWAHASNRQLAPKSAAHLFGSSSSHVLSGYLRASSFKFLGDSCACERLCLCIYMFLFVCLFVLFWFIFVFSFLLLLLLLLYYYYYYLYVCFVRDRKSTDSDKGRVRKDLEDVGREETIVRIYHIEKNLFWIKKIRRKKPPKPLLFVLHMYFHVCYICCKYVCIFINTYVAV